MDRKELLKAKLEESKKKRGELELKKEMERIVRETEGFHDKYRFADEFFSPHTRG